MTQHNTLPVKDSRLQVQGIASVVGPMTVGMTDITVGKTGIDYKKIATEERNTDMETDHLEVNVVGRIGFGSGSIDASHITKEKYRGALEIVASPVGRTNLSEINFRRKQRGQSEIRGIMNLPSNCMDGRKNGITLAGTEVLIGRPKLPGGETLYATDVFSIMGLFDGTSLSMLERFERVVKAAPGAASMHLRCGMAGKGSEPVLRKLRDNLDDATELATHLTNGGVQYSNFDKDFLRRGIEATIRKIEAEESDFHEAAMIEVIRSTDRTHGDEAILELQIDTGHPNHSHEEGGLVVFMGRPDEIMVKKPIVENNSVPDLFYYNMGYSDGVFAHHLGTLNQERLTQARKVGLLLPIAAVGALGKDQWMGSVGNFQDMLAAA